MSKFLAKVIKKGAFLSGVLTGFLVAAIVVGILLGFKGAATVSNGKKVTVSVDPILYQAEVSKDDIKNTCDDALDGALYFVDGDNGNGGELVYAFSEDADIDEAVKGLKATFADWTKDGGKYESLSIVVSVTNEEVVSTLSKGYILRGAIACAVMAVLAFAYVSIRYGWRNGVVATIAVVASILLTGAVVILTRIPATVSVLYAMMISGLATVVTVLFNFHKLRSVSKGENAPANAEDLIVASVAVKETAIFTAILGGAILLVGIPAGWTAAWFAVSAFVGVALAAFMGLIYVPSLCLPMQKASDAKAASATKYGYKGAKKGTKPAPKAEPKKEEVKKEEPKKEEPAPAPVEEKAEEAVQPAEAPEAEETPAETETSEEASENAEVPVEEPAEESVEEELSEEELADIAADLDDIDL